MFSDPDMKEILRCALAKTGEESTINHVRIREGVSLKAAKLRSEIAGRLKGKRVSLSADFGNRNGVDFFGRILDNLS